VNFEAVVLPSGTPKKTEVVSMEWWIWVLLGFLLLFVEMASTTMHVGFFAAGAFLVGLLVGVGWGAPLWQQLLVFTTFSLIALFFIRPPLMRRLRFNETKAVDTMVGENATTLSDIDVDGHGKAEMRGSTWNARNVGSTPLSRGQRVTVERVEGLVLHIKAQS
jgi:membrane protein implicated in regulation of membrane protease activity